MLPPGGTQVPLPRFALTGLVGTGVIAGAAGDGPSDTATGTGSVVRLRNFNRPIDTCLPVLVDLRSRASARSQRGRRYRGMGSYPLFSILWSMELHYDSGLERRLPRSRTSWLVYTELMRRIQLYMDSDLDDALTAEAARLGTSRSALVREAVRVSLNVDFDAYTDPVDELVGGLDIDPDDDIDSVVYGPEL